MPEAMAALKAPNGGRNKGGGAYVDRDKPAQIRFSNISAAKGSRKSGPLFRDRRRRLGSVGPETVSRALGQNESFQALFGWGPKASFMTTCRFVPH